MTSKEPRPAPPPSSGRRASAAPASSGRELPALPSRAARAQRLAARSLRLAVPGLPFVAAAALALAAGATRAEEPCAADAARVCAGIPPGDGRVYYCLRSNWNILSDGCKTLLDWSAQQARDFAIDCQGDVFAYCQGTPPGKGRVYACLVSHRERISSQCQEALARAESFAAGCGGDAARLCPGLPKGEGAVLACLLSQRDKLSDACRAVFWP
jgi:Golgi apparatus protein 1